MIMRTSKQGAFLWRAAVLGAVILCAAGWAAAAKNVANKPRILQTNFAGDNITVIDPTTNKVVGNIPDIEVNHGVVVAPDGMHIYVSSEADNTVRSSDSKTFKVITRIPLSGHPNNIGIGRDGSKVYVTIISGKGGVDVIDTASQKDVKTIETARLRTTPTSRRTASTCWPDRTWTKISR